MFVNLYAFMASSNLKLPGLKAQMCVKVQLHQFQVGDVVQGYSQATPAAQTYAALILERGDTFVQGYWNTSQESRWHGYDQRWDAGPRYPWRGLLAADADRPRQVLTLAHMEHQPHQTPATILPWCASSASL